MRHEVKDIIDLDAFPIADPEFGHASKKTLDADGVLVLPGFIRDAAVEKIRAEGAEIMPQAFYTKSEHNVYLAPTDDNLPENHCRNRNCLLYTSPSPRDRTRSRMPSSA